MKFNPYPYQQTAIRWVEDHPRCALFLDMGLGKTVATLTAIADMIEDGSVARVLVVAPKTVAEATWSAECAKWEHLSWLRVSLVAGSPAQRRKALERNADIYVLGRDLFEWIETTVKPWPFDMLVLDELTTFKSPTSKRSKALRRIAPQCERVVGLTGTPAPNSYEDLWMQIYPLDFGERLGKTLTAYRSSCFSSYTIGGLYTKYTLRKGMDKLIQQRLADICLTMEAKDFLSLPELIEIDREVVLPEAARKAYEIFEREQVLSLSDGADVVATSAAALMNKLSQYTSGALYIDPPENTAWSETQRCKLDAICEIVEEAKEPVLIFYQFRHEVPRITAALPKSLRIGKYQGAEDLKAWNAGKYDVLLAHPASTAYGLNMQHGGRIIIWTQTGWNLELYLQACARLHRQGQQKPVLCYRLVCRDTVDMKALGAIKGKHIEQAALLRALSELRVKYLPKQLSPPS